MNRDFNLLRYPNLARQQRWRQRVWGFAAGLTGSLVLAWVGLEWLAMSTGHLRQDLQRLQASAVQRQQAAQAAQTLTAQRQSWQRQQALLVQVTQQQQAQLALYAALQDEAPRSGLSLQRLHTEPGRLELHAQAPGAQAMAAAGQRLSQRLGQPLAVSSLSDLTPVDVASGRQVQGQAQALSVTWQGQWPRWAEASGRAASVAVPSGVRP